MKNFYDFDLDSPQERHEREQLFPELSKFHIALREELSEDEYKQFYMAEKESLKAGKKEQARTFRTPNQSSSKAWIRT